MLEFCFLGDSWNDVDSDSRCLESRSLACALLRKICLFVLTLEKWRLGNGKADKNAILETESKKPASAWTFLQLPAYVCLGIKLMRSSSQNHTVFTVRVSSDGSNPEILAWNAAEAALYATCPCEISGHF